MQIDRLFEIIYMLMEKGTLSAKELADRLEVSTKTIYRDIDRLSRAGMPLYTSKGKGGGISILPGFVIDKALLNEEEKLNILSAVRAFSKISPEEAGGVSRMDAFLGGQGGDWIEVDFSSWSSPVEERNIFNTLKQAILSKQVVVFSYVSNRGQRLRRTVEPLKLGFKGQAWYLYAYCRDRGEPRFFKLTRIKELSAVSEKFSRMPPAKAFPDENVFKEDYISLTLRLPAAMAHRVYDEFSDIEANEDGSFTVTTTYPKGMWLFSYLWSFGTDCEILSPQHIKDEYLVILKNIINIYDK